MNKTKSQTKKHPWSVKKTIYQFITDKFNKTVTLYGTLLALLLFVLKYIEYQYIVRDLSLEILIGLIAALFTALGIWIGLRYIDRNKKNMKHKEINLNQKAIDNYNISNREYEVLQLMSKGLSNKEIADQLFISVPTVKTHSSNLFVKLDVRRRTQAISKAKELNIII